MSKKIIEFFDGVVQLKNPPTLEHYLNKGNKYWRINVGYDAKGKTVRRQIGKDESNARTIFAEFLSRLSDNDIDGASSIVETYTDNEFKIAVKKLAPYNATILQAVDFFIRNHRPNKGIISLKNALDIWVKHAERDGKSNTYIKAMRKTYAGPFVKEHGNLNLMDINLSSAEKYIYETKNDLSTASKAETIKKLRTFFNDLASMEYYSNDLNPFTKMQLPKEKFGVDEEKERAITPSHMKTLLEFALSSNRQARCELLIAIVFRAFCGVRTEEILRLGWKNINMRHSRWVIKVPKLSAKMARKRNITVPANAQRWLDEAYPKIKEPHGPIVKNQRSETKSHISLDVFVARQNDFHNALKKHCKVHKKHWEKYEQNGYRVSCASYGLHHFGREKICRMMAEKRDEIFWNNYNEAVDEEDAKEYFEIVPDAELKRREERAKAEDEAAYEEALMSSKGASPIRGEDGKWHPVTLDESPEFPDDF